MYSVREFAHKVGVSRQYIWVLIKKGRVSAHRIGSYYVIPESELSKYASSDRSNNQLNIQNKEEETTNE